MNHKNGEKHGNVWTFCRIFRRSMPAKLIVLFGALWLPFHGVVHATADRVWRSTVITNEDGLSNSAVNSIYRDSDGFMWFGTWDGLNRFDGNQIKTFHPDFYDDQAISSNIIRQLFEDGGGNLWVVTEKGINKYSRHTGSFTSWFGEYPELALREHSLRAVACPDGDVWALARGMGLFRYDQGQKEFAAVSPEGITGETVRRTEDFFVRDNGLFLLTEDSLFHVPYPEGPPRSYDLMDINPVLGTMRVKTSWFCSAGERDYLFFSMLEGGLVIVDLHTKTSEVLHLGDWSFRVTALNRSADHTQYWLGTDDGNVFRMVAGDGFALQPVMQMIPALADKKVKIWSLFETPDDILWVGTDGEGVFRTLLNPKPFFQISRGAAEKRQLNHQIVRAIYEDSRGNLWVGTRGAGLNYIPSAEGPTRYYTTANGLTNDAVLSVAEDHHEILWIGHDGRGIDIFDRSSGRFFHFPRDLEGGEDLEFGSVYDICVDMFGTVWLATSGYGVMGLDIERTGEGYRLLDHTHIVGAGPDDMLRSNIVYSIVEEKPNVLWLGTRGGGIYRMNTLSGELENYSLADASEEGLNDDDVLSLYMGKDNIVWVGTSGGLNRVDIRHKPYSFSHYTTHDGLPNNTIHAILQDRQGKVWVSTNKGLSKLNTQTGQFVNFNHADGLQSNEYADGAAAIGQKTERFYFGGINGLDWFHPEEIIVSDRLPPLLFTGLRVYNTLIIPGDTTGILAKNINELDRIVLRHHQNFFDIEFTALNFVNPEKSLFEYKLEHFNTDWIRVGNQREASFTNVPDGKYRLMVRATNEDGLWSDEVKELAIIILPPFWRTWPAYVLYTIGLVLTLYAIYRYQSRRIQRKQQQAMERMQRQKEKELHQYKLQFFTNLAHEFGTPLTLIFASAASLLNPNKKPGESSSLVTTIYQNSRRMQRLVQEILEFRKIDTGREKIISKKTELVTTLNNIVQIFTHFVQQNELELSFEPDHDELWVFLDQGKLEKILLNLLSNAIKYTPPGGIIKLMLYQKEDKVILEVVDTGVGIPEDVLPYIFDSYYQQEPGVQKNMVSFKGIGIGLAYAKSLVELLGGAISVKSKTGEGSTFVITLPYNAAEPGNISQQDEAELLTQNNLSEMLAEALISTRGEQRKKANSRPDLWTTPKKYRILVAEDDSELSNLLLNLLSEQYDVTVVPDGEQALKQIQNTKVDVVVSDIVMPEIDGLSLCRTIKSDHLTSHIPVILLTARTEIENRIEGLEMGADSYIPKPFHPRHLFVRIERLLKAREQVAEYFKANFGTPSYDLQQTISPRDRELLEKCVAFIESNYQDETLDAGQLASHLAFSKPQLYRKIKALTGLTPHALIKNFRLKMARQMIAEDVHSISDIIYMTGFNNRTYFYRSYKEVFGETPGDLNKNSQKQF